MAAWHLLLCWAALSNKCEKVLLWGWWEWQIHITKAVQFRWPAKMHHGMVCLWPPAHDIVLRQCSIIQPRYWPNFEQRGTLIVRLRLESQPASEAYLATIAAKRVVVTCQSFVRYCMCKLKLNNIVSIMLVTQVISHAYMHACIITSHAGPEPCCQSSIMVVIPYSHRGIMAILVFRITRAGQGKLSYYMCQHILTGLLMSFVRVRVAL